MHTSSANKTSEWFKAIIQIISCLLKHVYPEPAAYLQLCMTFNPKGPRGQFVSLCYGSQSTKNADSFSSKKKETQTQTHTHTHTHTLSWSHMCLFK